MMLLQSKKPFVKVRILKQPNRPWSCVLIFDFSNHGRDDLQVILSINAARF